MVLMLQFADWFNASGVAQGSISLNEITVGGTISTAYVGGWFLSYTPNASGLAAGETAGQGYVILAPDGSLSGITGGSGHCRRVEHRGGRGKRFVHDRKRGCGNDCHEISNQCGALSKNGIIDGTLSFRRTGVLLLNGSSVGIGDDGMKVVNVSAGSGGPNAVINWNSFAIGSAPGFPVPGVPGVTLNAVISSNPSTILGALSSNGRVFIINPAGVIVGHTSNVNGI